MAILLYYIERFLLTKSYIFTENSENSALCRNVSFVFVAIGQLRRSLIKGGKNMSKEYADLQNTKEFQYYAFQPLTTGKLKVII